MRYMPTSGTLPPRFKGVRLERAPPAAMLVLQCDVTNPDPVPAKRYIDPQELGTGADTRTGLSLSHPLYYPNITRLVGMHIFSILAPSKALK